MTNTYAHGTFVWHEVLTKDVERAKDFYGKLFGWTYVEMPMPEGAYTMIKMGEQMLGGLVPLAMLGKEGVPSHWMPYVSVPNVDEAAAGATANGGTLGMEPMTIPNVGRMVVIGDPQHAYTTAFKSEQGDTPKPEGLGTFCWDELQTTDVEAATKFYGKLYGWQRQDFPGSAEMKVFMAGDKQVASMEKAQPGVPAHWLTFVVVANLETANQTVTANGGKVMMPLINVPGVGDISVVTDPDGAVIGCFEAPKA